ncbi:MAG: hypothetical protein SPJ55_08295 [Treponema sp.]|nr:hypothetical protein [Treponema sp.]
MQIFKTKKVFIIIMIFSFIMHFGFSQTVEMPSMPSMPDFPSVSQDGSFYRPSFPSKISNQKSSSKNSEDSQNQNETVIKNQSVDIAKTLLDSSLSSTLTASDISTLYDSGLFGNLSSIQYSSQNNSGTGSLSDSLLDSMVSGSGLQNYSSNSTTNFLLKQVLTELENLKNQQKKASDVEKQELSDVQTDSKNFKQREPSVLRFKINGYDISKSLTKTFFSDTEADGSFLFTADRKYFADNKTYKETFYMLFSAENSKGSTVFYNVEPYIVQENKNENSYVYKFLNKKNITAEKTGNLVVLHFTDDKLTADILLDIDKKY